MKFARQAQAEAQVQTPVNRAAVAESLVRTGPVELDLSQLKFVAGGGGKPAQVSSVYDTPQLPHGQW